MQKENRTFEIRRDPAYTEEKEEQGETSHEREHTVPNAGGLPNSKHHDAGAKRIADRALRENAPAVSQRETKTGILSPSDGLQAAGAPFGRRQAGAQDAGAADPADDANRRSQRETEGRKHDALGAEDEQYP